MDGLVPFLDNCVNYLVVCAMMCILTSVWHVLTSATFWTACAAIVVGIYTYYARQQWLATAANLREAKRSADAAEEALKISRDELRISVRPWAGITDERDGVQTSAIKFDAEGNASMEYSVIVKNYSSNAAQNVMAIAFLVVSEDLEAVKAKLLEVSGDNFVGKTDMGFLLFPGNARMASRSVSVFPRAQMVSKSYTGKFEAFLVGCVGYRDQFGVLYHTKFVYWLADPSTGRPIEFDAIPNGEQHGVFIPWHSSID
jgi:hypothetical protein